MFEFKYVSKSNDKLILFWILILDNLLVAANLNR